MIRVDKTKLPYLEAGQQSRILTLVFLIFILIKVMEFLIMSVVAKLIKS